MVGLGHCCCRQLGDFHSDQNQIDQTFPEKDEGKGTSGCDRRVNRYPIQIFGMEPRKRTASPSGTKSTAKLAGIRAERPRGSTTLGTSDLL